MFAMEELARTNRTLPKLAEELRLFDQCRLLLNQFIFGKASASFDYYRPQEYFRILLDLPMLNSFCACLIPSALENQCR